MKSGASQGAAGQVLSGVRVVELGHAIAAPFAAGILSDFGAEVIKIERPGVGDPLRGLGIRKSGESLWWKSAARNKKSVTLDFTKPDGSAVLRQLVDSCDILIENFRPGVLEKYGMGWKDLSASNPDLIMVRISGYGQDTSDSRKPGFGRMADAMSGAAHLTGEPDGSPAHVGFSLADTLAGLTGAFGAVMALFDRQRTGQGECIDVALFEPLFRLIDWQVIVYDQLGLIPNRAGGAFPVPLEGVAAGVARSRDGVWMSFSSATDSVLQRLIGLVIGPDALDQERFRDADSRRLNSPEVQTAVGEWIATRTAEEVEDEFARADAVVCRILSMQEIWNDRTVRERNAIIAVPDPDLGDVAMHGVVPKLTHKPGKVEHTGPKLGAHTESVLTELGIAGDSLDDLRRTGVI